MAAKRQSLGGPFKRAGNAERMDYQILPILDPSELEHILVEIAKLSFVDGKATAAGKARG
jgi:hypothetical protein